MYIVAFIIYIYQYILNWNDAEKFSMAPKIYTQSVNSKAILASLILKNK